MDDLQRRCSVRTKKGERVVISKEGRIMGVLLATVAFVFGLSGGGQRGLRSLSSQ